MSVSTVLVAVNGDSSDDEAVKLACQMVKSCRGKLYLLHVIEVDRGYPIDAEIGHATARGEEILKHVEQVAKPFKCNVEAELVQARSFGSAVVQEAADREVDVIVLGIPYEERYGSFSLGETVPYVLKNAPCRVIVWREPPSGQSLNGRGS
ncbi:MAG: universal stress protein [Chloroflexi bacterium]|nr:universal stress protein [Chloroflexota bacterium]